MFSAFTLGLPVHLGIDMDSGRRAYTAVTAMQVFQTKLACNGLEGGDATSSTNTW